jgi:hypothetical protein
MVIPQHENGIIILCCIQSQKRLNLKTYSISVCPSIQRMPNGGIYMCSVSLLQKMPSRVKPMTWEVMGLVLFSLLNMSVVGSKVPSSSQTNIHETFNF